MKPIFLVEVGWLVLHDIPVSQRVPILKSGGCLLYTGCSQDSDNEQRSPRELPISVGSLTVAMASGQCEDTSLPDITSKGSQHLSFYL